MVSYLNYLYKWFTLGFAGRAGWVDIVWVLELCWGTVFHIHSPQLRKEY